MCTLISIPWCAGCNNSQRTMVTCLDSKLSSVLWKPYVAAGLMRECVYVSSWGRAISDAFIRGWGRNKELEEVTRWQCPPTQLFRGLIPTHNWMSKDWRRMFLLANFQLFANVLEKVPCDFFFYVAPALTIPKQLFSSPLYCTSVILLTWKPA